MEEQTPIENNPQEVTPPVGPAPDDKAAKTTKLLIGAVLAIGLAAGLYFLNRYWIAPAVKAQSTASGDHPMAPAFSLTDIAGKPLKLSDYQGKVVMLDFWATWCGPCRIEIPGFVELQNRYGSQGFAVIGISMDTSAPPVEEFYKLLKMNYPVAIGNDRMLELYGGLEGFPTTFLIGRDGRIYAKHVGATDYETFEIEIKELLAASPTAENTTFRQAGRVFAEDKVSLGDPAAIDSEIPGVNITKLTADEKEAFKKVLENQHCPCGCKLNLLKCREVDRACSYSKKLAQEQLTDFQKKKNPPPAADRKSQT